MFKVVLYEDRNGHSEIKHQISSLKEKSKTNKDARIQFRQIVLCIKLLEKNGFNLPINFLKHVQEDIWELRPGKIEFSSSTTRTTHLFLFVCSERKHKRHPNKK